MRARAHRRIAPIYEELSNAHPDATFLKIDVDEQAELAAGASVSAMPTFQIYKGGLMLDVIVGANPDKLKECVETHSK